MQKACSLSSPLLDCEVFTDDFFTLSHLSQFLHSLIQTIQFYSEGKTFPVVRIPTHGHELIACALDAGAAGIICPHIETAQQVRDMVAAAKYAPLGHRSMPPFTLIKGLTDHSPPGGDVIETANEHAAVIPQIESGLGIENLEEICQVPGVDAIMIGSGDLRMDIGLPLALHGDEPEFLRCMERATSVCKKYNLALVG